jgi:hypothetical protein
MRLPRLSKKKIDETLEASAMYEVLNVGKTALTSKQLKYCEHLARGETKAGAYRKAYNSKGNSRTVANKGWQMAERDDIKAITEAIKRAIEFERSYSAGQVRALVAHRLTVEAIAEDSNPSVRVNALKALGTIAGVDSFIHRSETKVVKDSDKAKDELLEMLKRALSDNSRTINEADADILALMNEIEHGASLIDPATISDPLPPLMAEGTPADHLHTIPDTQSLAKSSPPEVNEKKDDEKQ